jgi:SAM-dependent methyltransferase
MSDERLHLGCGSVIHPGWTNIDVYPYPGVDRQLDVRQGLPFEGVEAIFAEHFIEHFDLDAGAGLLRECRRVLAPHGVLRLTTPNLDWVWATSYASRWKAESDTRATIDVTRWKQDEPAARDCLTLNRAFHGWGHRFLYNAAMLEEALRRAGFAHVQWCEYGRSTHEALNGLERHEQAPDSPALPHLLIAEASGLATHVSAIDDLYEEYLRDLTVQ